MYHTNPCGSRGLGALGLAIYDDFGTPNTADSEPIDAPPVSLSLEYDPDAPTARREGAGEVRWGLMPVWIAGTIAAAVLLSRL